MTSLSDYYFDEPPHIICGLTVPSIVNDFNADCPSVVDRFFSKYYYRLPDTEDEDHLILFHSNRVCLVGLAPSHIALEKGITAVNYNIGNCDRSMNVCSGKGKKGAMNLQPPSALAILTCRDGSEYKVLSCVTAKLIEVNGNIAERPELLAIPGDGYVAVCLPKPENCEAIKAGLLSVDQYAVLNQRSGYGEKCVST